METRQKQTPDTLTALKVPCQPTCFKQHTFANATPPGSPAGPPPCVNAAPSTPHPPQISQSQSPPHLEAQQAQRQRERGYCLKQEAPLRGQAQVQQAQRGPAAAQQLQHLARLGGGKDLGAEGDGPMADLRLMRCCLMPPPFRPSSHQSHARRRPRNLHAPCLPGFIAAGLPTPMS